MPPEPRFCPQCATPLQLLSEEEDGGPKARLRCPACGWTHWNNPTPVLAAIIELPEQGGQVLLARNAAWTGRMFGLITGFMEAARRRRRASRARSTRRRRSTCDALDLVGVYEFQRMNQVIIAYHALARGEIVLSPELVEYRLIPPAQIKCWPAGTGYAVADWLRSRGIEPQWMEWPAPAARLNFGRSPRTSMQAQKELDTRGLNCPLPDPEGQEGARRHDQRRRAEGGRHRPRARCATSRPSRARPATSWSSSSPSATNSSIS